MKIEEFSFLIGEPSFFKKNYYSFAGGQTCYGVTVFQFELGLDKLTWVKKLDFGLNIGLS